MEGTRDLEGPYLAPQLAALPQFMRKPRARHWRRDTYLGDVPSLPWPVSW
jgi:hypothetical protein